MRHSFIDAHSAINSYIHQIDPRVKIICFFALVIAIVLLPPKAFVSYALFFALILGLIVLSKIPIGFIVKRLLIIIPFVLMIALFVPFIKKGEVVGVYSLKSFELTISYGGLMIFWNVLIKSSLSVLSMIVLMNSMPFSDFLKALERLRIPRIFTMILSFMYRYVFLLEDELMKMKQAKESRSVGGSKGVHIRALSHMLGVLFVRAYERGEQVYLAMCSRGFTGTVRTMSRFSLAGKDILFCIVMFVLLLSISIAGVQ